MIPVDNYYESLDSFLDARKNAKAFRLKVELKTGETVTSSSLPIDFWTRFVTSVEAAEAAGTALSVWDRDHKQLMMVPHNNIRVISVILID